MLHDAGEIVDEQTEPDGRTARRDRNRVAAIDAVLELFAEGDLSPTPERVASRSGVSLRSVYRYFADRGDLIRAAVDRHLERVQPLFVIDEPGAGTTAARVERFVEARLRGYEAIAATARASRLRAPSNDIIREQLDRARHIFRAQLEQQFAPELAALEPGPRRAVFAAADALTQIETIDLYRVHGGHSAAETHRLLVTALRTLFDKTSR
jgi:TetR/AcrR family transcriptional regulator of autoinduction and epiphytic fitness